MLYERNFRSNLIKDIEDLFPGCIILKNDPAFIQGFPDLLILFKDKWAALELKRSKTSSVRPNQRYYVEKANAMSYASFIYPENRERILNELQQAFRFIR